MEKEKERILEEEKNEKELLKEILMILKEENKDVHKKYYEYIYSKTRTACRS